MTRLAQTLALWLAAPFLLLWALFMLTLVFLAQTWDGTCRIWR